MSRRRRRPDRDVVEGAVPEWLSRFVASEWVDDASEPLPLPLARSAFVAGWRAWTEEAGLGALSAVLVHGAARRHAWDPSWPMPWPYATPVATTVRRGERHPGLVMHPWEWPS